MGWFRLRQDPQYLYLVEPLLFTFQSARSLLKNLPDRPGVIFRPIYEENAQTPETLPLNIPEEILPNIISVVQERGVKPVYAHRTYWNNAIKYNPLEVFGATIQSLDLHDAPLPQTVLPPEDDVAEFIENIKAVPHKVKLEEQLSISLEITGNDLLGAVNLCWIATRFMARGADQRAYPNIPMNVTKLRDWNGEIAQFKAHSNGLSDGPGDNYYFWTHAFAAMIFSDRDVQSRLSQAVFSKGTQIMAFTRKYVAKGNQPNITTHQPASRLGRETGLVLANLAARMYL